MPDPKFASNTVTAIRLPEGLDGKAFLAKVNKDYNVILGGGQKSLVGKIFRVGHMGWVEKAHIDEALKAAEETLKSMMIESGFEDTQFFNMTGGIVAAHRGIKL